MKKKHLLPFMILSLLLLSLSHLNAIEIQKSQIKSDAYVILLGTYLEIESARRFANTFEHEEIYILKDKDFFTVRIVNIHTKQLALEKLKNIRKSVPDAMLWKKMSFLKKQIYDKLHSQIYTIDSEKKTVNRVKG